MKKKTIFTLKKKRMNSTKKLVVILGPTACGKTSLSLEIAKKLNRSIVAIRDLSIRHGIEVEKKKKGRKRKFDRDAILLDYSNGMSTQEIAKKHRCSLSHAGTIRSIFNKMNAKSEN